MAFKRSAVRSRYAPRTGLLKQNGEYGKHDISTPSNGAVIEVIVTIVLAVVFLYLFFTARKRHKQSRVRRRKLLDRYRQRVVDGDPKT
jgi:hypothetical protein